VPDANVSTDGRKIGFTVVPYPSVQCKDLLFVIIRSRIAFSSVSTFQNSIFYLNRTHNGGQQQFLCFTKANFILGHISRSILLQKIKVGVYHLKT
jgi:hypothetical protein